MEEETELFGTEAIKIDMDKYLMMDSVLYTRA